MLLSIIKWIGIVLLVLLGLILLILGLVLFVPVRYKAQGSFISGVPDGKAHAGWLLDFLQLDAVYRRDADQHFELVFKVLGIPVRKNNEPGDDNEGITSDEKSPSQTSIDIRPPEDDELSLDAPAVKEEESSGPVHAEPAPSDSHAVNSETASGEAVPLSEDDTHRDEEGENVFAGFFRRVSETCKDISVTLKAVYRVIRQKCEAASKLINLYTTSENAPAFKLLKKMLFRVLRELTPRKGSGKLILGTGDPYTTAQALEILLLLSPSLIRQVEIVPDFDHEIHDFDGSLRGAVRIAVLLWAAGRVFFNKKIRIIYKQAKKIVQQELLS